MLKFEENPSFGTAFQFEELAHVAEFGDGYRQAAPQGINAKRLLGQVVFSRVRTAKAKRVVDFFRFVGTTVPFLWTAPAPWDDEQRAWVVDQTLDHQIEAFDAENITVVLRQSFNSVNRLLQPSFSSGSENGGTLTISHTNGAGTAVRYTLDGTNPTDTKGTLYTVPVPNINGKQVRAVVYTTGAGGLAGLSTHRMNSPIRAQQY